MLKVLDDGSGQPFVVRILLTLTLFTTFWLFQVHGAT